MANSPRKEAVKEEIPEVPAPKPAGRKKLILISMLVLVLAGGGAWFALKKNSSPPGETPVNAVKDAKHGKKEAAPVYLPLEAFVVNLRAQAPQTADQFLQTEITLRLAGQEAVDQVKLHMPEVRNRVLMLLSNLSSHELLTPEGKTRLAESVRVAITSVVDPNAVAPADQTTSSKQATSGAKPDDANKEESAKESAGESAGESTGESATPPEAQSPEDYMVKSVLFTSFIIQ